MNKQDLKLKSAEFFKTGEEKFDGYPKQICPLCGSLNVKEKERGGGLFTSSFSYYYCSTCHKEHQDFNCEYAVRKDVVQAIIQDAMDNKISTHEMIKLLSQANINIYFREFAREKYGKIRDEIRDGEDNA